MFEDLGHAGQRSDFLAWGWGCDVSIWSDIMIFMWAPYEGRNQDRKEKAAETEHRPTVIGQYNQANR